MIQALDKKDCCGCSACAQRCPKQCIIMQEDSEGFLYPHVNKEACTNCGLCEKVCPTKNELEASTILGAYAAKNDNKEIRMQSSSGGIFSLLAEKVIREGGVVFGARFDKEWQVIHSYTETIEGLAAFRGSKYVQSVVGNTYKEAEQFLKEGRKVLYSGTPCQIAGLKHYLRKEYVNLLVVECICHSVPSPLVWRMYLQQHCKGRTAKYVNFRDKTTGWSKWKYSLVIDYENGDKEIIPGGKPYMLALGNNLSTRPSCSNCKARCGKSRADISLGDYWGVWATDPEFDDNKGVTIVMAYSKKGQHTLNDLTGLNIYEVLSEEAKETILKYNGGLCKPKPLHPNRLIFFEKISGDKDIDSLIEKLLRKSIFERIKLKLRIS